MTHFFKWSSCACLIAILSACSSGGSDATEDVEEALSLVDRAANATIITDPDELPSSATMTGFLALDTDATEGGIVGDMTVNADFETGEMDGEATNLREISIAGFCLIEPVCEFEDVEVEQSLGGTLTLDADITGTSFDGTLSGTVSGTTETDEGMGAVEAMVDLEVDGGFGEDAGGLLAGADLDGTYDGTVTLGEDTSEIDGDVSGGFFVAE